MMFQLSEETKVKALKELFSSLGKRADKTSGENHEDYRCFSDSNTLVRALDLV